jgi:hypothetical protein
MMGQPAQAFVEPTSDALAMNTKLKADFVTHDCTHVAHRL